LIELSAQATDQASSRRKFPFAQVSQKYYLEPGIVRPRAEVRLTQSDWL
jgi:hypothetical protein